MQNTFKKRQPTNQENSTSQKNIIIFYFITSGLLSECVSQHCRVLQCKSAVTLQGPSCVNVFRCIIKHRESKICPVCYTEQERSVCSDRFWAPSGRQVPGFATDCIIFPWNLEKSLNCFNRELILHAFNLHFCLS